MNGMLFLVTFVIVFGLILLIKAQRTTPSFKEA